MSVFFFFKRLAIVSPHCYYYYYFNNSLLCFVLTGYYAYTRDPATTRWFFTSGQPAPPVGKITLLVTYLTVVTCNSCRLSSTVREVMIFVFHAFNPDRNTLVIIINNSSVRDVRSLNARRICLCACVRIL